jgi:anti-sigma regulatory factor (Ser/Thr protein kinase)
VITALKVRQRTQEAGRCSADHAFEQLRGAATRLLQLHTPRDGMCAGCGHDWPCRTAVLAEHNLTLVHDTPDPTPPNPDRTPVPHVHPLHRLVRHYPAVPRSAGAARSEVAAQLRRWDLHDLVDTAAIVVSELISNAVAASQHTQPTHSGRARSRVAVALTYRQHDVIVEVWDSAAAGRPTLRAAGPDAEDGRGLPLVAALTRHLGYRRIHIGSRDGSLQTTGTIVWAVLPHTTSPAAPLCPTAPAGRLPRRHPPIPQPDGPPPIGGVDVALLQRTSRGLRTLDSAPRREQEEAVR